MNPCRWEEQTARAARTGIWPAELRHHASSCPVCNEIEFVTAMLGEEVFHRAESGPSLPDPHSLWLRARIESRRHQTTRATWPILWMQGAGVIGVMVALALFLPHQAVWKVVKNGIPRGFPWNSAFSLPWSVLGTVGLVALLMAGLALAACWDKPLKNRLR